MGQRNGAYSADFPVGTRVRIRSRTELQKFYLTWFYHDPLELEQLDYAGAVAVIKSLGYYHGGGELYWLVGIPGTWHEACLELAESGDDA